MGHGHGNGHRRMTQVETGAAAVPGPFSAQRTSEGSAVLLALYGELDLGSAPELDRQLQEIEHPDLHRLVIDLSGLRFMDSTGLASIMQAQRRAQASGHELVLRRPTSQVRRLFELTGVTERLTLDD
jgi:anti-sigma B factor antagonist